MPEHDLARFISVGVDVIGTSRDENGRITAQTGDVLHQVADPHPAMWVQHVGYASRPSNPTAGKAACQSITVHRGDRDVIIGTSDARCALMAGSLKPGETCIFAGGADGNAQGRSLYKADGSVNHYTRVGNTPSGAGMLMQLDAANNAARILNGLGYALIIDTSGITLTVGKASITLNATTGNISIVSTGQTQIDGTAIVLGSSAIPPVPGVQSALFGATGMAGLPSTKVFIPL